MFKYVINQQELAVPQEPNINTTMDQIAPLWTFLE